MRNVLEAATAVVAALGVRYGEVTIQVVDGEVVLFRQGTTMKPEDLAAVPLVKIQVVDGAAVPLQPSS